MKNTRKKAQSLIEYGLILAMVAVVAVVVLGKFGNSMTKTGDNVAKQMDTASSNAMKNYCSQLKDGEKSYTYDEETGNCKPGS